MRVEIYGEGVLLNGDIRETLHSKYLAIAGVKAHIKSPIMEKWVDELTLGAQYVHGKYTNGVNIGIGVKF